MGGVASVKKNNGEDEISGKELTNQRRFMMDMVENFILNVYASSPRIDAMWLILSSKLGQKAFSSYIKTETPTDYLELFLDISDILASREINLEFFLRRFETTQKKVETEFYTIIPELLRNEILAPDKETYDTGDDRTDRLAYMTLLDRLQYELVFIMAKDYFHGFLISKNYKNWRAAESSHAMATTTEDAKASPSEMSYSSRRSSRTISTRIRFKMRKIAQPADLSFSAYAGIEKSAREELFNAHDSWLTALIAAMEALPICFSVLTAKNADRVYPIIYVNKYFEKITGYKRQSILGKLFEEFLFCEETETEKVAQIPKGLKEKDTVITLLTNQLQDGKIFKHVLGLKPLFNSKKVFVYVIGLHFDVTQDADEGLDRLSLVQELLDMLPDTYLDESVMTRAASRLL